MEQVIEGIMHWPMPAPMFIVIGVIILVGMVIKAITRVAVTSSQERTKREVAAYVAQGSLDADQAVKLLDAGKKIVV